MSKEQEELLNMPRTHEQELIAWYRNTKVNRPIDWQPLDMELIEQEVNNISVFEYKMIMNTCKTNEIAILAIKKYRDDNDAYVCYLKQIGTEKRTEHYRRSKYNDLEDDIEKNY